MDDLKDEEEVEEVLDLTKGGLDDEEEDDVLTPGLPEVPLSQATAAELGEDVDEEEKQDEDEEELEIENNGMWEE